MRSPKNESFSGDRISAHIKARASQPKTLSKYYGHPYSFRIFCGNRNFLRIQIRRALPITDRHALLRLPELRRKGRHAPLRQKTEKKETRNRCAIFGGIHRRNTVRNVLLAAVPPAIEGAYAPYAHCFAIGLSPLFRSSFKKTKGSRFGVMKTKAYFIRSAARL